MYWICCCGSRDKDTHGKEGYKALNEGYNTFSDEATYQGVVRGKATEVAQRLINQEIGIRTRITTSVKTPTSPSEGFQRNSTQTPRLEQAILEREASQTGFGIAFEGSPKRPAPFEDRSFTRSMSELLEPETPTSINPREYTRLLKFNQELQSMNDQLKKEYNDEQQKNFNLLKARENELERLRLESEKINVKNEELEKLNHSLLTQRKLQVVDLRSDSSALQEEFERRLSNKEEIIQNLRKKSRENSPALKNEEDTFENSIAKANLLKLLKEKDETIRTLEKRISTQREELEVLNLKLKREKIHLEKIKLPQNEIIKMAVDLEDREKLILKNEEIIEEQVTSLEKNMPEMIKKQTKKIASLQKKVEKLEDKIQENERAFHSLIEERRDNRRKIEEQETEISDLSTRLEIAVKTRIESLQLPETPQQGLEQDLFR